MSDKASFTTGIRARGISSTEISDVNLEAVMDEALYEFSRYRPLVSDRTFETVADQQKYTWTQMGDSAGKTVIECIWNPFSTGDEWDLARTAATLGIPREAGYWHFPSQDEIEQLKAGAFARNYGGKGYQIDKDGGSLYLTPTPEQAGETVYIVYTKGYTAVTEITSEDRDIWLDLLESRVCKRIANEISKPSAAVRVRTPEYEIQRGEQIGYWRKRDKESFAEFLSKINAGEAAAGRS